MEDILNEMFENLYKKVLNRKKEIIILIFILPLFWSIIDFQNKKNGVEIILTVENQIKPLNYQVFYTENGKESFSQKKSLIMLVDKSLEKNVISFKLNIEDLKMLRIDLGEDFETLSIKSIQVKGWKEIKLSPKRLIKLTMSHIDDKKIENGVLILKSKKQDPYIVLSEKGQQLFSKIQTDKAEATAIFILFYFFLIKILEKIKSIKKCANMKKKC